jgi:hypothetical protein
MPLIARRLLAWLTLVSAVAWTLCFSSWVLCQFRHEQFRFAHGGQLTLITADPEQIRRVIAGPWAANEKITWASYPTHPSPDYIEHAPTPPPPYVQTLDGYRPGDSGVGTSRYRGRFELRQMVFLPHVRGKPPKLDSRVISPILSGSEFRIQWWAVMLPTAILPVAWVMRFLFINRRRRVGELLRACCRVGNRPVDSSMRT